MTTGHLMKNIDAGIALHRAFSVFLFDSNGKLLLQQRSMDKITFPGTWTNSCCSHPLWKEDEINGKKGVMNAAVRKLEQELGITGITTEDFTYVSRIVYKAPSDGLWGEHEVDYILFAQKDVTANMNPNEVMAVRYVSQEELKELFLEADSGKVLITPWFRLICKNFLFKWWSTLSDLSEATDNVIHDLQ